MPPTTRVVAVTGVDQKSATKEMMASVLSQRFSVVKSLDHDSDLVNVPLALLDIRPDCEFGIFELHSNQFGDIPRLANLLRPDIAVITRVGVAPM